VIAVSVKEASKVVLRWPGKSDVSMVLNRSSLRKYAMRTAIGRVPSNNSQG
jgi:hypothetical protein